VVSAEVVVASRDIGLGLPIAAIMLQLVPWPTAAVPSGSFTELKELDGRVVIVSMQRGEPVLKSKLAPVGTKGGLSAVIPQGKRALTVKVNEVVGVAGFALPGNYVDVMVNTQDDRKRQVSKIVLEKILVLAVAQQAARDDTKPKVVSAVTLEVTPLQAEKLDLARSVGSLSLALRNQIDANPTLTSGARKDDLLGLNSPPPAPVAAAPVPVAAQAAPRVVRKRTYRGPIRKKDEIVEVIRGVQRSSARF
ncbi:MAG: Flp pilus assembly protein CpaB, partial [Quisquiliibacterium sp.]